MCMYIFLKKYVNALEPIDLNILIFVFVYCVCYLLRRVLFEASLWSEVGSRALAIEYKK